MQWPDESRRRCLWRPIDDAGPDEPGGGARGNGRSVRGTASPPRGAPRWNREGTVGDAGGETARRRPRAQREPSAPAACGGAFDSAFAIAVGATNQR
jgi:hypothetical protein